MKEDTYEDDSLVQKPGMLEVSHVSFVYPGREKIYEDFNLSAFPGQIMVSPEQWRVVSPHWVRPSSVNTLTKEGYVSTAKNYPK